MLLMSGHGATAVKSSAKPVYGPRAACSVEAACGFTNPAAFRNERGFGAFAYLFPDTPEQSTAPERTAQLDALADAMVLTAAAQDSNSTIPPVFTYFGQFIDHDITANTDTEVGLSVIDAERVTPAPRAQIKAELANLRSGALNLDSVHGGGPVTGDFAKRLTRLMRFRRDRAKLWGGTLTPHPNKVSTQPQSGIRDLIRLEQMLEFQMITEEELRALQSDLRDIFIDKETDKVIGQKAIIGDMRNDENLAVAQFHMAIQRLHNEIVQRSYTHSAEHPDAPDGDTDALFDWARRRTTWIYQWLIVHSYLPAICDPDTLASVMKDGPVLYRRFYRDNPPVRPDLMPLPFEFSVAAFRFGHTMARDAYDWNEFFEPARFQELFLFTGNGQSPMNDRPTLPTNWPIDWARFVGPYDAARPDRAARQIDTRLAFPLGDMLNEPDGDHQVLKHLARRNLRRGHRLNIPDAQAILDALDAKGLSVQRLSAGELLSRDTGDAVKAGGFQTETPLWFYVLKEAEIIGNGERLGPLGTRLIADTLLGLMDKDPSSYLNAAPGGAGWMPAASVKPNGVEITDMPSLMRAAGVMA